MKGYTILGGGVQTIFGTHHHRQCVVEWQGACGICKRYGTPWFGDQIQTTIVVVVWLSLGRWQLFIVRYGTGMKAGYFPMTLGGGSSIVHLLWCHVVIGLFPRIDVPSIRQ